MVKSDLEMEILFKFKVFHLKWVFIYKIISDVFLSSENLMKNEMFFTASKYLYQKIL